MAGEGRHETMTDDEPERNDAPTTPEESSATPPFAATPAVGRDVLWALAHGAPVAETVLRRSLEEYYGRPLDPDDVRPVLAELVDRELVEERSRDGRTDEYRLTERGERALSRRQAWIDRDGPPPE